MKILAIVILYSLLSGILCSCGRNKRNLSNPLNESPIVAHKTISNAGDTLIICDINRIKDTINFPLSLLLSDLEIVKLDDKEDATIDNVSLQTVSPNHIGLYSFCGGIKLFDRSGNYISDISKKGQGPDEYILSPSDMLIDEAENRYYFTGPGMENLMAFDLYGNPKEHIPLARFANFPDRYNTYIGFRFDSEHKTIKIAHVPFSEEEPVFWIQDLEGNLIQWLSGKHLASRRDFSNTLGNTQNTTANDYCIGYWYDERVDSLYHYDEIENRMKPVFTANLDCISKFHKYIELPGYYYIYIGDYGGVAYNNVYVLIDKQTLRGSYIRFKLDMLGNIGTGQWLEFTRGYYVRCIHPAILQEQWQGSKDFTELPPNMVKFMRYLQTHDAENMNNVVLIGKLKQSKEEEFVLHDMK